MVSHDLIFWDVDTQYDFMKPDGSLYSEGMEKFIPKISAIRRFALDKGYSIIASQDWHEPENPEIDSETPDFDKTFPLHCPAGDKRAERIGYLGDVPIEYISPDIEHSDEQLKKIAQKEQFHVVLRKNDLDVFTNPNTRRLLKIITPRTVVVYGVVLDFCVQMVVNNFCDNYKFDVVVIKDAVPGLGKKPEIEYFRQFDQKGARLLTFEQLKSEL